MSESLFDVAIVGGGATGLAAAIQAASDGLRAVLLERYTPGGRIRQRARVEVVPGLPIGPTGEQFAEQAVSTAIRLGAEVWSASEIVKLERLGPAKRLRLTGGTAVDARAVIIATGTDYPDIDVPGIREFTGRGVYFGLPRALPEILRDREVFVTGEPGAAAIAAGELAEHCRRATIVSIRMPARFEPGADREPGLGGGPQAAEKPHLHIADAVGAHRLETLVLRDARNGRMAVRNAAALFVLGIDQPRTGWLAGAVALDARGYVLTGDATPESTSTRPRCCALSTRSRLESSRPGVFAAGGARGTSDCCLESLGGEGVCAARQALHHVRAMQRATESCTGPEAQAY